jgi:protein SCO1/2
MMKASYKYYLLPILLLVLTSCGPKPHQWNGSPYQNPKPAPEIILLDTGGDDFRLSEQRGKAVLLFFGYTYCPDVCPATVAEMRIVFDQLGEDADRVVFGLVTVDPERDTPEVLESYLERHHAQFYGLRGDKSQLETIKEAYGVYAEKDSQDPENYLITHTARVFLVDTEGILQTNYSFGTYPEEILADLQYILDSEK